MSIRAKLFVLTIGVVLASLVAIIALEINYVREILKNYNLTNVISDTKLLNENLDNQLDLMVTEHAGVYTTFLNLEEGQRTEAMKNFARRNDKFFAFFIVDKFMGVQGTNEASNSERFSYSVRHGTHRFFEKLNKNGFITNEDESTILFYPTASKKYLIVLTVIDSGNDAKVQLVSLVDYDYLNISTEWTSNKKMFITTSSGEVVAAGPGVGALINRVITRATFKKNLANKGMSGVYTGDDKYILSYASSRKYPFSIYSWSTTKQANFIVIKEILRQITLAAMVFIVILALVYYLSKSFTQNIRLITFRMIALARGDLRTKINITSKDEIGQLAGIINLTVDKLAELTKKEVELSATKQELETANLIQNTLMPENNVETKNGVIVAFTEAMTKCGGDWWSHFSVGDRFEYICIADATGHGPSAAMVTSIAFSAFEFCKQKIATTDTLIRPSEILSTMNNLMGKEKLDGITMTGLVLLIDHEQNKIHYSNGAHVPMYYFKNGKIKSFLRPGFIIGLEANREYKDYEISAEGVSRIVLFSDGITEAVNPKGKQFGNAKFRKVITKYKDAPAEEVVNQLKLACEKFRQGTPYDDDYTMVFFDFKNTMKNETDKSIVENENSEFAGVTETQVIEQGTA